jgi:hypothetical protein
MAQKRMFSKTITNSSRFLMMPQSSQNLYFHFGMNADDDGFCEHFSIMRMTESKPDDLKILQAKQFIKVFDDKVLIILDWKENNYIRQDRYTPSKYLELYKNEIKLIESNNSGIPNDNRLDDELATQIRLDKIRLDKNNINVKNQNFSRDKNYINGKLFDIFDDYQDMANCLYNLYPSKDFNNKNRSTHKSLKDKEKIIKLVKTGLLPKDLSIMITNYIEDCQKTKTFMMDFKTFLNNLPELEKGNDDDENRYN